MDCHTYLNGVCEHCDSELGFVNCCSLKSKNIYNVLLTSGEYSYYSDILLPPVTL